MTSKQWVTLWSIMLCCYRMFFTSCDRCISILAVLLIFCSLDDARQPWSKWPQMIKKQSYEPSVRSLRAKVARNGKSRVGGGELFSDKSRYWHLLSILTIFDGKMKKIAFESIFFHYLRLLYWLISFFQKMRSSIFDIQESFFLKYPVSL